MISQILIVFLTIQNTALPMGTLSPPLKALDFALIEWHFVTLTNVFIGNFLFVAGL